jgi:hypothetical protein
MAIKLLDLLKETTYGPKDMIPQGKLGYIDESEIPGVRIEVDEDVDYRDFANAIAKEFASGYGSHLSTRFLEDLKNYIEEYTK